MKLFLITIWSVVVGLVVEAVFIARKIAHVALFPLSRYHMSLNRRVRTLQREAQIRRAERQINRS